MLYTRRTSIEELEAKLAQINETLRANELTSGAAARAGVVIEDLKRQKKSQQEIDRALAEQGLPSLQEVGQATVHNLYGYWKLNNQKLKLEKRIIKLSQRA